MNVYIFKHMYTYTYTFVTFLRATFCHAPLPATLSAKALLLPAYKSFLHILTHVLRATFTCQMLLRACWLNMREHFQVKHEHNENSNFQKPKFCLSNCKRMDPTQNI